MKVKAVRLDSLTLDPKNARKHSERNLAAIKESLSRFGQRKPIVVRGSKVLAGNGTLEAARSLGWTEIQVAEAPDTWDEDTAKAYALADNRTAELAEWDEAELAKQLLELEDADWDIEALGFEVPKLHDVDVDEDEIPEPPVEPVTKLGDIWQLGRHRLMCGDSTDEATVTRLMNGAKADMVFTDPPYGIDFVSDSGKKIQNDNLSKKELVEFNKKWQKTAFYASNDNVFMLAWASPRLFHLLDFDGDWQFFRLLTMYKSNRISFPHGAWINKTEPCLVFTKGKPQISTKNYLDDCYVYTHDKESHQDSNVGHPTPKPVKMIVEHLTACILPNNSILDLFGGSGATLIAAEQTDRTCYMMELDPKYCDVIIKRWETLTGLKAELVM